MKKEITILVAVVITSFSFNSCSKLQNENSLTQPVAGIHGEGFANPASLNSHVKYIQAHNWDIQSCKSCHGAKFDGGTAQKSCLTCHTKQNGPENCTTCHGSVNPAPPVDLEGNVSPTAHGVGAHQAHVTNGYTCSTCHSSPTTITDVGHLDASKGAEVKFDTVKYKAANQLYNATTTTCSNTYCHGNFQNGNTANVLIWTDTTGNSAACGTCHGDVTRTDLEDRARPKTIAEGGTHPNKNQNGTDVKCFQCHGRVVDANLNFVDKSRHSNGTID